MGCVKEDFMASYPSFEFLKILSTFFSLQIYIYGNELKRKSLFRFIKQKIILTIELKKI